MGEVMQERPNFLAHEYMRNPIVNPGINFQFPISTQFYASFRNVKLQEARTREGESTTTTTTTTKLSPALTSN